MLPRWASEMGKSGQLFSSVIQDGKRLFEQRPHVGYSEAKAESWHLHFAFLRDSFLPVYYHGLISEKLHA